MFERREIHATWATVGLVGCDGRDHALEVARAHGLDSSAELMKELGEAGADEQEDPFRFAPSLVREILKTPHQELATHTFSHLLAFDRSTTPDVFAADLSASLAVAEHHGARTRSLVFPGNESTDVLCRVARDRGITCYRGNPPTWGFDIRPGTRGSPLRRAARWLDSYLPVFDEDPLTGARTAPGLPVNVPATRFLRATKGFGPLAALEARRIKRGMERAAQTGTLYHLWFHDHNFTSRVGADLDRLEEILEHFECLRMTYGMQSRTMHEVATVRIARERPAAGQSSLTGQHAPVVRQEEL